MGFLQPQRDQLDSVSLAQLIPADAKCRFIVAITSKLDLSELYARYSSQGGDACDPATLLATWFYAYSEGQSSTRKLEQLCQRDLHFIYVSGHLKPDHTTLSRFRRRNLDLFESYFLQLLDLAKAHHSFAEIAIDGSKMRAWASKKKNKDSAGLDRYLRAVRHSIARFLEKADDDDDDAQGLEALSDLEARLVERKAQLEARKKTLKSEHRDRHQINITEPEACAGSHGVSFNVQLGVDTETHLIVNCDVVTSRNDVDQLQRQHQRCQANLGQQLDGDRRYTLDSGYHSFEALAYAQDYDILVNDPAPHQRCMAQEPTSITDLGRGRVLRSHFGYDADQDCYHCPAGQRLDFTRRRHVRGARMRVYQSQGCPECAIQEQCSKSTYRHRDEREPLAEAMSRRLQTPAAQARLKRRSQSVEPVFGNIKHNLGFRRFSLRGLSQVRGEFTLMALAHNLNKLFSLAFGSFWALLSRVLASARQWYSKNRSLFDVLFCFDTLPLANLQHPARRGARRAGWVLDAPSRFEQEGISRDPPRPCRGIVL